MEKTGMAKIMKTARKKRRARLILAVTLSLVFIAAAAIAFNIIFSAANLTVVNNTSYSDQELLDAAGISSKTPLLFMRESVISEKVTLSFPYVESVKVERQWPRGATVTFEKANPKYLLETHDGTELILSEGFKVLEKAGEDISGLITVKNVTVEKYETGKKISGTENIEVGLLAEIVGGLKNSELYERLTEVDFTKKYNYVIILDGTITVELGTSDDLDKKFDKLSEILKRNSEHTKMNISVRNYKEGRCTVIE